MTCIKLFDFTMPQRLFAEMMLLDQSSCSPERLTSSFGWSGRDEVVQHDVQVRYQSCLEYLFNMLCGCVTWMQELNRVLFSAIEQSLAGTSGLLPHLWRIRSLILAQAGH